jgi:hypothetical protein
MKAISIAAVSTEGGYKQVLYYIRIKINDY